MPTENNKSYQPPNPPSIRFHAHKDNAPPLYVELPVLHHDQLDPASNQPGAWLAKIILREAPGLGELTWQQARRMGGQGSSSNRLS